MSLWEKKRITDLRRKLNELNPEDQFRKKLGRMVTDVSRRLRKQSLPRNTNVDLKLLSQYATVKEARRKVPQPKAMDKVCP